VTQRVARLPAVPASDGSARALRRIAPVVLFGVAPAVVVVAMFLVAVHTEPLAWDFRNELYPQTKALLEGENPYPDNLWPPLAMLVAAPFTALASTPAGVAFALVGIVCVALALWLVGLRDWRVYGVVGLWPPVLGDIRIAHLTPLLCLLTAVVWRYRDRPLAAGSALGVAGGLKFFLWPLGIWLLATGRVRATGVAAVVAAGSLLLVVPFAPLDDYLRTLRDVSSAFDQDGYSTFGLLTQLGVDDRLARAATIALGAALLILTWRRRSFALAIAGALVLSPIVWLDFYALAAIPLAIARPRLSAIWLLPLVTWGLPSSGIATDPVWGVARLLAVFAVVLWFAAAGESQRARPRRRVHEPA
jgi:alpha-1,2-mannosyltransferase